MNCFIRRVFVTATFCGLAAIANAQVPVDTFIDFENGTSGQIVTDTLLNSCSHGDGTWHTEVGLNNAILSRGAITNMAAPALPGPVSVGGTVYNGGGTRALAMRRGDTFEAAVLAPSVTHSKVCVGYWWNPGFAGTSDFSWDDEVSI